MTKTEAKYVDVSKYREHCSTCSMFRVPRRCTLVLGVIKPNGWCKHWGPKKRLAA